MLRIFLTRKPTRANLSDDTICAAASAARNLQLVRLKIKKPTSKITGKDGFAEAPLLSFDGANCFVEVPSHEAGAGEEKYST